jgi:hypothetical protein
LQSGGYVPWAECQKMRTDVAYGYRAGARELTAWMNDARCKHLGDNARLRCALAGHDAGNAGVATYRTVKYVDWVLHARDRVVKFATFAAQQIQRPEI